MKSAAEPSASEAGATPVGRTFGEVLPRVAARQAGPEERLELAVAASVAAALTLFLAFNAGGYFPAGPAVTSVAVAALLALRFALIRRPAAGLNTTGVVAVVALAALAAWTLLSSRWSDAPFRAVIEYDRALAYALVVAGFACVPSAAGRVRVVLGAVLAALLVVCGAALIARTMPDVLTVDHGADSDRLSWPLTYWNGLGLMAALGILLCVHFTSSLRESAPVRIGAAIALPIFATTLYFTFARGPLLALAVGLTVYVVVARPRGMLTGLAATVPPVAVALLAASPPGAITDVPATQATIDAGGRVFATVVACAAAAGLVRGLLLRVDGPLANARLREPVRRRVLAAGVAVVLLVGAAAIGAADVPQRISDAWAEFKTTDSVPSVAASDRFLATGNNGRIAHWDIAMDRFREQPLRGDGAGTYAIAWHQNRTTPAGVEHAHNLYVEVLSELGLPGLLALATALLALLFGVARRCRGSDRALHAAVLAAVVAWAAHAGLDWDWEMPATGLGILAVAAMAGARPRGAPRPAPTAVRATGRVVVVASVILLAVLPARVAVSEGRLISGLDALWVGNCDAALSDARGSLAAVGSRPEPYQLIAWCSLRERPSQAVGAMEAAIDRDPSNWELHYNLAVARAASGQDPRPAAAAARRLNPLEQTTRTGVALFAGDDPATWRRAARAAPLALPPR